MYGADRSVHCLAKQSEKANTGNTQKYKISKPLPCKRMSNKSKIEVLFTRNWGAVKNIKIVTPITLIQNG